MGMATLVIYWLTNLKSHAIFCSNEMGYIRPRTVKSGADLDEGGSRRPRTLKHSTSPLITQPEATQTQIHSIEFENEMCSSTPNELRPRKVVSTL